ncbi:hypothetical protein ACEZDB_02550 [Streptacidiphilus sp. N1-3]|uniref:Uncharacterized protein n=1 Tax=Streptacidiphilus alkalitolerans TaxID=3342712 RepID=A0ABV6WU88_9ACTN
MADSAAPSTLALPVDDDLFVRLHGTACIICGTTQGPLNPAGHAYTGDSATGRLGWSVVACAERWASLEVTG